MDLKDVRFSEKTEKSGKKLISNKDFKDLKDIILGNQLESEIVISFFDRNKDNTETAYLEDERLSIDFERYTLIYSISEQEERRFEKLKRLLLKIYQKSPEKYFVFRSDFTEYLAAVFISAQKKSTLGVDWKASTFFHEPYVFYKRKRQLQENVFDIVHINRLARVLDFYECKANINTFLRKLNYSGDSSKKRNAQSKLEYMKHVYFYFYYLGCCELEVCFFTLTQTISKKKSVPSFIRIIKRNEIVNTLAQYENNQSLAH